MKSFEHVSLGRVEEVFPYMRDGWSTRIIAGGTDLLHEMKHDIIAPSRLLNIKTIPNLRSITDKGNEISIGALATINDIEHSTLIRDRVPILAVAAGHLLNAVGLLRKEKDILDAIQPLEEGADDSVLRSQLADVHVEMGITTEDQ